jgi:hypothetical protein
MKRISVRGAIDMHFHSYPSLFPRVADDWEIIEAAQTAGMQAVVIKAHHESTVSRSYLLSQKTPQLKIFGGIVLDHFVGGVNPAAVEAALALGGKTVWMPTVDAAHHAAVFGFTGGYDRQKGQAKGGRPGIRILEQGTLTPETHEVLALISEHGAILGTAHLSPEEILVLVREARKAGVEKILIQHAMFPVPNLPWTAMEELVALGAILEIDYCGISPMWAEVKLEDYVRLIERFGAEHCILVSDAGQTHNPLPSDALRLLAQNLYERGVSEENLHTMMIDIPKQLLEL